MTTCLMNKFFIISFESMAMHLNLKFNIYQITLSVVNFYKKHSFHEMHATITNNNIGVNSLNWTKISLKEYLLLHKNSK